ncbi:MAG: MFS transporter [Anaerolineae bacterium]|nr:MFS transporter [Anaerolineae bacterium]
MSTLSSTRLINDKREIFGWTMYDWANSAFSTTVGTVFLGPYLTSLANAAATVVDGQKLVYLLGIPIAPGSFMAYCVSISVGLQVLFLPLLGAISDYSNLRKAMMMLFATLGAIATTCLFFVTGGLWWLGGLLFILGNLSFGAAIVFYNAYLPDIATEDQRDSVSSRGFAMGYLGGGLLLLVNIVLFLFSDRIGIDSSLAVRINLASAGIWWLLFSQVTFRSLHPRAAMRALPPGKNYLTVGISQLRQTFSEIKHYPHTIHYLIAYLVFNDGIQTVIGVSSVFGAEELKLDVGTLSGIILMVQFVAYFGAHLFDHIARRVGAKNAIIISLVVWATVTIYAYGFLFTGSQFWLLGAVIALVLGGSQALSRSLFSKMIPPGREAEFFSFYEISERGTSWFGPLVFGLVNQITGSMRLGILSLIVFFVLGLILLIPVNVKKAIEESQRV